MTGILYFSAFHSLESIRIVVSTNNCDELEMSIRIILEKCIEILHLKQSIRTNERKVPCHSKVID